MDSAHTIWSGNRQGHHSEFFVGVLAPCMRLLSLQSSYHPNSVTASDGRDLTVENTLNLFGFGSDSGGGHTHQLLLNLYERFGSVSSFTGTYQADEWRLTIDRDNPSKLKDITIFKF